MHAADDISSTSPLADKARRLAMVGWYNPGQLLRTAVEVVVSTQFSKHSDSRRLDAFDHAQPYIDYRRSACLEADGSFAFDYLADTGDGWNSTYAMAYALAQPTFPLRDGSQSKRGSLLILGGDLVYPYPTRDKYEDRLVAPFTIAGQLSDGEPPEVIAIPGNHDWYDSLVNFRRLFCAHRFFGCWRTRQSRSYFAARLPRNWWLLGVDVQLDGDLDESQFHFFQGIIDELGDDDQLILCAPEPFWHLRWERSDGAPHHFTTLLEDLERELGDRLRVSIAGDLHHYQRASSIDDRHRITCGTGGAFLHPTHEAPADPTDTFAHRSSFPDKQTSRRLAFRNLAFVKRNPWFGIVPAFAYLLAAWQNGLAIGECFKNVCIAEMGELGLSRWPEAIEAGIHSALLSPIGIALYGIIFFAFIFFGDRRSNVFRYSIGVIHASSHIVAGFAIYWFSAYLAITTFGLVPKSIAQYVMSGTLIFCLSWVVGSIVLGCYLLISLNVFGMHRNEAFSALRIQDWKGFLRLRIDDQGHLHIAFIGFEKVPRAWRRDTLVDGRVVSRPATDDPLLGEVIDRFVVRHADLKTTKTPQSAP